MFLIGLIRVRTVNLVEIATGFSGKAKVESHYKRLQRFLRDPKSIFRLGFDFLRHIHF